jgi:glycosyltransferase involved in cell wall biosynthesis
MNGIIRDEPAADLKATADRPLDILILSSEAPPIISGISTCIDRLATGLAGRQHHVKVLSSVQIGRLTLGEWRLSPFLAHWPRVARELRHFDVVNVHGPVPTMSDAFLRLADLLPAHRRPAIVYTHHSPIDIRGAARMSVLYNKLHKSLALRADRIVASSHHYADQHRSRFGPRVWTIPWGVDKTASAPSRVPRPPGELRVLFVGQMRPYKGLETLLAAAAGQPWLRLTLVGNGPALTRYQRLARRSAVSNVRFAGTLPDAELQAEYAANDVIVLPSVTLAEAFGLVLVEGMAAGCVPVASDLPGVRDVAGPTGMLIPPGDPGALRAALECLAHDVTRLERLQAASVRMAEAFSWERCVVSYERVMLDAVRGRHARLHGLPMLPALERQDRLKAVAPLDAQNAFAAVPPNQLLTAAEAPIGPAAS